MIKHARIDKEVRVILAETKDYIIPDVTVLIHNEEEDIKFYPLRSYRTQKNFNINLSDVITVEGMVPIGKFIKAILQKKDSLEVTVSVKYGKKTIKKRYKGILLSKLPNEYDSKLTNQSDEELDTQDMFDVVIQCVDPIVLALKNTIVSGIYHNLDFMTMVKAIMSEQLNKLLVLGKKLEYKFNIYPFDNTDVYKNIILKPFTNLAKLPYNLQNLNYGLYNSGVGIYFSSLDTTTSKSIYDIYIYPLFDYDRYDNEKDLPRLLIINPNIYNVSKNNYKAYFDVDTYKIIISDITFSDEKDKERFNDGNALIETIPNLISNDALFGIKDDEILFDSDATYSYNNAEEILDYTKYINTNHAENTYTYNTNMQDKKGIIAIIKLPNINSEVLIPGMAVKYLFLKNDKVVETTGIIQLVDTTYDVIHKTTYTVLAVKLKRIK